MFQSDFLTRTMLIERLTGVFVYFSISILSYNSIKKSNSIKQFSSTLRICMILLVILAFLYIPSTDADLYRWRIISDSWREIPLKTFFNNHLINNSTPIAYLIMYLCVQFNIKGMLPAICAAAFYHNSFSILKDLQAKEMKGKYQDNTSLAFFVFMSSGAFLEVISGVRCFVAFSFIAKEFYYEIYNERKIVRSIPVYIFASLIHNAVIPIICIRFLYFLFQKTNSTKRKILNACVIVAFIVFVYRYGSNFIDAAFIKADNYISGDTYSYTWEYLIGGIQWLLFAYIIYYCQKTQEASIELLNIIKINKWFLLIEALFIFEYNIFHRMILLSSFLIIPIVSFLQSSKEKNQRAISIVFLTVSLVMLIACARGNLCGYKFFLLSNN